ncbi:hypothetical protein GCM10023196_014310 [Actinoallomurus vinaceus]|uniref:Uncharacterized protein n=1 Tax=Actinoallomurus vinaceus TaxID=1080074 RepID=A0ABP8U2P1_9ACTN
MARPKTLRPADFAVMTTTAVLLNVRHDLATPADQHPMMAPGPVRVVHRGPAPAAPPTPTVENRSIYNKINFRRPARAETGPDALRNVLQSRVFNNTASTPFSTLEPWPPLPFPRPWRCPTNRCCPNPPSPAAR